MKLGIISDIHEDIVSLVKAFQILEEKSCDEIICLGDIVGVSNHYNRIQRNRNAGECLRLVKKNCKYVISGNHDLFAIRKIPVFMGGFNFPDNWYQLDLDERATLSSRSVWLYEDELSTHLDSEHVDYISSLPEYITILGDGMQLFFSHFLFPDITGSSSTFPANHSNLKAHFEFVTKQQCSLSVCGHMHAEGMIRSMNALISGWSFLNAPFEFLHFGKYKIRKKLHCIAVPAVANTERQNGVALLDTRNQEIHIYKINQEHHRIHFI